MPLQAVHARGYYAFTMSLTPMPTLAFSLRMNTAHILMTFGEGTRYYLQTN